MELRSRADKDAVPGNSSDTKRPLLKVQNLGIRFSRENRTTPAVRGLSYQLGHGRTLGVVGESGCGKTISALAILGLIDPPGEVYEGEVWFEGKELCSLTQDELAEQRGAQIAMVFQEPMTALNPVYTIGEQISEVIILHQNLSRAASQTRTFELLDLVRFPSPSKRAHDYPHQLSGGLRQRAMIAMALAGEPALLIADEPTTALDVTLQSQIVELFLQLQNQLKMAIQFISHDFGVISEIADEVMVLYAGRPVEHASASVLFQNPLHPYTRGLLATVPRLRSEHRRLPTIPGQIPDLNALPRGCPFHDRCFMAEPGCAENEPNFEEVERDHWVACPKVRSKS